MAASRYAVSGKVMGASYHAETRWQGFAHLGRRAHMCTKGRKACTPHPSPISPRSRASAVAKLASPASPCDVVRPIPVIGAVFLSYPMKIFVQLFLALSLAGAPAI